MKISQRCVLVTESLLIGATAVVFALLVGAVTCAFALVLVSLHAATRTHLFALERRSMSLEQLRRVFRRPLLS